MPLINRQIRTLSSIAIFCLLIACCMLLLDSSVSVSYKFLGFVRVVPYALYSLPYIIRVIKSIGMREGVHVAHMGDRRGTYKDLTGRPEGRSPLGRPRTRWEDNIKMDLQEVGWGDI